MEEKKLKKFSKFMSLVLRHDPAAADLKLDQNGWASVDELLRAMNQKGMPVDMQVLKEIVETNDKKRFVFSEDQKNIRAAQGHSVEIEHILEERTPPAKLYHGTPSKNEGSIWESGISKGNRHHVHLSVDLETAIKVATRRSGKYTIFVLDCDQMVADGLKFYISANDVWLVDFIDPKYLSILPKR